MPPPVAELTARIAEYSFPNLPSFGDEYLVGWPAYSSDNEFCYLPVFLKINWEIVGGVSTGTNPFRAGSAGFFDNTPGNGRLERRIAFTETFGPDWSSATGNLIQYVGIPDERTVGPQYIAQGNLRPVFGFQWLGNGSPTSPAPTALRCAAHVEYLCWPIQERKLGMLRIPELYHG